MSQALADLLCDQTQPTIQFSLEFSRTNGLQAARKPYPPVLALPDPKRGPNHLSLYRRHPDGNQTNGRVDFVCYGNNCGGCRSQNLCVICSITRSLSIKFTNQPNIIWNKS